MHFEGRWDRIEGAGISPLPVQRPIPIWIGPGGGGGELPAPVLRRIGRLSDGWFAIIPPDAVPAASARIHEEAEAAGRDPSAIGIEGAIGLTGKEPDEWLAEAERGPRRARRTSASAPSAAASTRRATSPRCMRRAKPSTRRSRRRASAQASLTAVP